MNKDMIVSKAVNELLTKGFFAVEVGNHQGIDLMLKEIRKRLPIGSLQHGVKNQAPSERLLFMAHLVFPSFFHDGRHLYHKTHSKLTRVATPDNRTEHWVPPMSVSTMFSPPLPLPALKKMIPHLCKEILRREPALSTYIKEGGFSKKKKT